MDVKDGWKKVEIKEKWKEIMNGTKMRKERKGK